MSDDSHDARNAGDDWVEALLRADAKAHDDEYLGDEGFTARVMQAIAVPAALPAWRRPLLFALWGLAAAVIAMALPDTLRELSYDTLRVLASVTFSLRDVAVAVLGIAAASWAGTLYMLRREP
ncbi:MAG TPA: hypothetical protein VFC24_09665 [Casimicrobiaceae bacterium]|nr:hypothetical protein [Casimicrobiaceae bacterium]